jgi:DMSO/TMAO reductase YedYZ molybdopterin-dependent catalytic subunit
MELGRVQALPKTHQIRDIHCVTKWSKLDTPWDGVLIDDVFKAAGIEEPPTRFILAHSFDGYSTNVPVADLVGGQAMIALRYDGKPLPPDHGGPARLLVPHLYFWKSAKWVSGLQFTDGVLSVPSVGFGLAVSAADGELCSFAPADWSALP